MTSLSNQQLYRHARTLIPGGTQLLSKRPEMYAPEQWPPYYREARGCTIVDHDGREWIDFSTNGIGSCLLGYADPEVNAAVIDRVQRGSMCTLNAPEEVELAGRMLALHPWAEQIRYARGGGEAMSVAVRIARARSGRDLVAFCGYHGWCDWYLAANLPGSGAEDALGAHLLAGLEAKGIPSALAGSALPFGYNALGELEALVSRHGGRLAAVVMEPTRAEAPAPGFLEGVRAICDRYGAALIFDEVSTGFRLHYGGVHLRYGVEPDLAVFAKALGNGHPVAAILGKERWMSAAAESFISSTYWTEGVGYAAALATLEKMERVKLSEHLEAIGVMTREGLLDLARRYGVPMEIKGWPAQSYLSFNHPEGQALLTLYTVAMLREGYLVGGAFYPTWAHTPEIVEGFLKAAPAVFTELAQGLEKGDLPERIGGPLKHSGFQRLN